MNHDLAARPDLIDRTAQLLFAAFRDHAAAWPTIELARQEVLDSLAPDRISRVIVDDSGAVLGWIGAMPIYDGHVWEVHPLVVARSSFEFYRRVGFQLAGVLPDANGRGKPDIFLAKRVGR